jgi:hypothetical protein
MQRIISYTDSFRIEKKNFDYQPNATAFKIQNKGNCIITVNDYLELKPNEDYGLLQDMPFAVCISTYRIKFGDENVCGDGKPVIKKLLVIEVTFSDPDLSHIKQ